MLSLESSNWSSLPTELLLLLLDGLMEISSYLRFRLVCKSWLSAAIHQKERRIRECQFPMLLVPTKDRSRERRSLYDVTQNKVLNFQLSVPYSRRCCGSCHGWLATVDKDFGITLLNPFSGNAIKFPSVTQLPEGWRDTKRSPFKYEFEVGKVVFSGNPSLMQKDFVVVAIYTVFNKLAYIKSGQKSWTCINNTNETGGLFSDAIFRGGKIYACDFYGGILSIDVSGCKPEVTVVALRTPEYAGRAYIVESSQGDLLMVQRFFEERDHHTQFVTVNFKIFKLLGANGGGERRARLVEIDSLGKDVLFLGDSYSVCVLSSDFSGCQANCIYYTDDYIDIVHEFPLGFRDNGVYCLEDASFGSHYKMNNRYRRMPPPIWITPTLVL